MCGRPSNGLVPDEYIMELLCCVVEELKGAKRTEHPSGHALLGIDAFGRSVCARSCALELKCTKLVAYARSQLRSSSTMSRVGNRVNQVQSLLFW